jgi:hypothetical protein
VIINRQHWGWATFVVVASVAATLLYIGEFHPHRLPFRFAMPASFHRDVRETGRSVAGTPLGLIYGGVAAVIFVFAALLGLRRKRPTLKVGRLQLWLKGHIWLTILTIPLVLLHCGFSSGSPMTKWFLVVYGIVMVSGFYGLALQHVLPRLMKDHVPGETIFEQSRTCETRCTSPRGKCARPSRPRRPGRRWRPLLLPGTPRCSPGRLRRPPCWNRRLIRPCKH